MVTHPSQSSPHSSEHSSERTSERSYIISQDEIERLRRQVNDLKRSPGKEPVHTHAMIESMDRLYEALSRMIVILENANRAVAQDALQGIKDEHAKLDRLLEQNEKLARGVVALADLIKQDRQDRVRVSAQGFGSPQYVQQPLAAPLSSGTSTPPSVDTSRGHEETSFLVQPVNGGVPPSPTLIPLSSVSAARPLPSGAFPTAPSVASSTSSSFTPVAPQLPPLPPLPVRLPGTNDPSLNATSLPSPPAPAGTPAGFSGGNKRPILRGFS